MLLLALVPSPGVRRTHLPTCNACTDGGFVWHTLFHRLRRFLRCFAAEALLFARLTLNTLAYAQTFALTAVPTAVHLVHLLLLHRCWAQTAVPTALLAGACCCCWS